MRRSALGPTDLLLVSEIGLGCNQFGTSVPAEGTLAVVSAALDAGVTFFDTADIYGNRGDSERFLGAALKGRRQDAVIATKFGHDMGYDTDPARGRPAYVRRAVEESLRRLDTQWIDLLYYHAPDGVTPLEETIGAMEQLVSEGLVRAIGCSNLGAADLKLVGGRIPALQNRYSLLYAVDETEVLPACSELHVSYVPWGPFHGGLLTGKHRRGHIVPGTRMVGREIPDTTWNRLEALEQFASSHGHTLLELAVGALLSHPAIPSVIAGATSAEQVRANVAAAGWRLSPAELDEVGRVAQLTAR
jgi:aryl-alcohol dehydrogenase-like predicted oxidoreductase